MRLLAPMTQVEEAVLAVERSAQASQVSLEGTVRVTSPETFGVSYLAPRLAAFGVAHRGLSLVLDPGGEVLDLGRRQAEVAVRFFRSRDQHLVVKRVGEVSYGLYASSEYLARHPVKSARELKEHPLLVSTPGPNVVEAQWVKRLTGGTAPAFVSTLSLALLNAARASAGIAVLPRYLGDPESMLRRLDMPDAPSEPVWLTVHQDLKQTPRVRAVLDFLAAQMKEDAWLLRGRE
jgi:DNA-binding transcriptional LysR family regulator